MKVLAVDDDRTAGLIFKAIAQRCRMEIILVDDCNAALAALQTAQFDVILMDWRMPGLDGMECTRMIRAREAKEGKHTPVIAVTASAMTGDREECLAAGADDYLSKPFKLDDLAALIEHWGTKVIDLDEFKRSKEC